VFSQGNGDHDHHHNHAHDADADDHADGDREEDDGLLGCWFHKGKLTYLSFIQLTPHFSAHCVFRREKRLNFTSLNLG